jgi:hypothetical protein
MDPVLERAGGCRQHDAHADRLRIDQHDVLDHVELHHPLVKLGILDRAERLQDGLFGQLCYGHVVILSVVAAQPPLRM